MEVTSIVQQKIGIRNIVIPGARIRNIVTRKLAAPIVEDTPRRMTAMIQRSMPVPSVAGERAVGGPARAAPRRHPRGSPRTSGCRPGGTSQNESALMRGNAMSIAPIWSGTM